MRKITFLINFIAVICLQSNAQVFEKGDIDINAGLGLGFNLYDVNDPIIGIPPVSVSVDYGLKDDLGPGVLGIGGIIGFSSFKNKITIANFSGGYKYTSLIIGTRGTYHISFIENLDNYGGMMLYYSNLEATGYGDLNNLDNNLGSKVGIALFIGSKYFFNEKIAAFGELGYSITWLNLGVSFKL